MNVLLLAVQYEVYCCTLLEQEYEAVYMILTSVSRESTRTGNGKGTWGDECCGGFKCDSAMVVHHEGGRAKWGGAREKIARCRLCDGSLSLCRVISTLVNTSTRHLTSEHKTATVIIPYHDSVQSSFLKHDMYFCSKTPNPSLPLLARQISKSWDV